MYRVDAAIMASGILICFFALIFNTFWRLPCKAEYPLLKEQAGKYREKRFRIFLIDLEDEAGRVKQFMREQQIDLPALLDHYGAAVDALLGTYSFRDIGNASTPPMLTRTTAIIVP